MRFLNICGKEHFPDLLVKSHLVSFESQNFLMQILVEDCQTLPNGGVRRRNLPLCEKLLKGEHWQDGAKRAIYEELGSALPANPETQILSDKHR